MCVPLLRADSSQTTLVLCVPQGRGNGPGLLSVAAANVAIKAANDGAGESGSVEIASLGAGTASAGRLCRADGPRPLGREGNTPVKRSQPLGGSVLRALACEACAVLEKLLEVDRGPTTSKVTGK